MSKIETELLEATGLKEKKTEKRQDYLGRLCRSVAKVPDEVWEGLSTAAQNWNNAAAERLKDGGNIVDFSDVKVATKPVEKVDEEVDEEIDEEETSAPVATKPAKPEKAAKPEKEKVVLTHTPGTPRKVSACHTIKKMVVKKPQITVAELSEKLKAAGLKVSDVTIATLRSDLRDTLRVLNELNIGSFTL